MIAYKTDRTIYTIIGIYNHQSEEIDRADDWATARYLAAEYRLAFGPAWIIRIVKGRD